ncbi:MAG: SDR family oxidoreductase [Solirubrobacterales bacterium]|nr:SDR family oxidoreductase [Solirubrobacterales bacterium]
MDQIVFITGGARGIGAKTAETLVAKGAKVILTDVDQQALDASAAALGEDNALAIAADVTDLAAMEAAVAAGVERFGGIDTVLANAGIASYGSVLQTDPETFKRVIDINITGVFNTVRAALPTVIERKGYVLVVSSLAAFAAAPGLAAYNASKAGVEHFANALRLEVKYQGVDVGSAHMSWIDTPLVQDAKNDLPSFREMLRRMPFPLNKTTTVEGCANAFVRGIENRSRHVYWPSWVLGAALNRGVINSAAGAVPVLRYVPELLPKMDAEVEALGRATSARNVNEAGPKLT